MDLLQALENIKEVAYPIAEAEVSIIRQHKEEAIPLLLAYVAENLEKLERASNMDEWDEIAAAPFYELFLLAEFRVREAMPLYLRMLNLHADKCDWFLGDVLTDSMSAMIAGIATTEDIPALKAIVENTEIEEFQRGAALHSMTVMYMYDKLSRDVVSEYIGFLLNNLSNEDELLTHIVGECVDLALTNFYPRLKSLYEADCIDILFIRVEELDDPDAWPSPEEAKRQYREKKYNQLIDDTIQRLSTWAVFREEYKYDHPRENFYDENSPIVKPEKIGRNEPCPCGSGNKYKRCCLHKDEEK